MLGNDQLKALSLIKDFIFNSKETAFSLIGSAGTGKTYLMNHLIKELNNCINIVLCAPTHKAKLVLERASLRECITLHSLLSLTPNLDIFDLDFRDLIFHTNDKPLSIPRKGLVICDEASMINDDLFNLLIQKCKERNTKLLFLSDQKQLSPVKSEYESLVYTLNNKFELTEIFRQAWDNALTPLLVNLRNNYIETFESSQGKSGSIFCYDNTKEFINMYIKHIKSAISKGDILKTKLCAYTNKRVDKYNEVLHQLLYPNSEYGHLEFITSNDNFEFGNGKFWNSMDYIICSEPVKVHKSLPHFFGQLPGYMLELYDSIYKTSDKVFILSKDISKDILDNLANTIEDIRIDAVGSTGRKRGMFWKFYYELVNSFTTPMDLEVDGRLIKKKTFSYGYACTTHRLQGSTFNDIFVDMKDINRCIDNTTLRQLQYVALSRAKNNAYILQ